ncbi:hypothetical protein SUDANB120_00041 [Streptomyces sp. enrichment culture]
MYSIYCASPPRRSRTAAPCAAAESMASAAGRPPGGSAVAPPDRAGRGVTAGSGGKSAAGTPPKRSPARPPEPCPARSSSFSAASTPAAGGAVGRTVLLRPEQSRQVAEHLAPAGSGHPFEGVRFLRRGAAVTSWTWCWSAQTWWRRSARIARWITPGCSATPCGSSGCAWTWVWRMCRGPGWDRGPRRRERPYGCSWLSGLFREKGGQAQEGPGCLPPAAAGADQDGQHEQQVGDHGEDAEVGVEEVVDGHRPRFVGGVRQGTRRADCPPLCPITSHQARHVVSRTVVTCLHAGHSKGSRSAAMM